VRLSSLAYEQTSVMAGVAASPIKTWMGRVKLDHDSEGRPPAS
jgi:hypothetical protein